MADKGNGVGPPTKLERGVDFYTWLLLLEIRLNQLSPPGVKLHTVLNAEHNLSMTNTDKARMIVFNSIAHEDLKTLFNFPTVHAMIVWLKNKYIGDTKAQCMVLSKKLFTMKLLPGMSVTKYIDDAIEIQRQMAEINQPQSDTFIIMSILNGLPQSYKMTVDIMMHT